MVLGVILGSVDSAILAKDNAACASRPYCVTANREYAW